MANTKVELLDKDGNVIGSGTTDNTGHVTITQTKPIPEGMSLPKRPIMQNIQIVLHLRKKRLIQRRQRHITSDLTGKATTTDHWQLLRIRIRKWNY